MSALNYLQCLLIRVVNECIELFIFTRFAKYYIGWEEKHGEVKLSNAEKQRDIEKS